MSSPVNSLDLDRDSPLGGPLDDDDDDGPPSIETQLPENVDDLEVSGITSTWIRCASMTDIQCQELFVSAACGTGSY